jgi:hypothetical protein
VILARGAQEIRNPKHEIRNKSKARNPNDPKPTGLRLGLRISDFVLVSDFEMRISDLRLRRVTLLG